MVTGSILMVAQAKSWEKRCPTPWNCSKPADRSSPWSLIAPGPTAAEIDTLLTIASRVPDHGKLTPWRFIVFEGEARAAAGEAIAAAFRAKYPDSKPEHVESERKRLARAPLVIAVVSRAAPHVKIPEWEQVLSAGAAAMSLVLAAHALGFGANWITEWYAYDRNALDRARGQGEREDRRLHPYRHAGAAAGRPAAARRSPRSPPDLQQPLSARTGIAAHVLRDQQERPRTAALPVQGDRLAASGRLGHLDEREGRDQSRAVLVLQRGVGRSADRDVLLRRLQGFADLRRGDEGVRLQSRDLRPARRRGRDLGEL